jgi:hypothetical protein
MPFSQYRLSRTLVVRIQNSVYSTRTRTGFTSSGSLVNDKEFRFNKEGFIVVYDHFLLVRWHKNDPNSEFA